MKNIFKFFTKKEEPQTKPATQKSPLRPAVEKFLNGIMTHKNFRFESRAEGCFLHLDKYYNHAYLGRPSIPFLNIVDSNGYIHLSDNRKYDLLLNKEEVTHIKDLISDLKSQKEAETLNNIEHYFDNLLNFANEPQNVINNYLKDFDSYTRADVIKKPAKKRIG